MTLVYSALVHHPVRDRDGLTATAAVTNIDVHDIARSSHTFGLAGMFVVTPIDAQRALVTTILEHWRIGGGKRRMPHRSEALAICQPAQSIAEAREVISARHGRAPRVIATAARAAESVPVLSFSTLRAQLEAADDGPWLLLFGTGHGLTDDVLSAADVLLEPIRGHGDYNHLSVRAAAAIVFDRLFGQR
ncbi:MAG TPA: RNA methyltransferase [Polyangiales bacterium]|nr:RNA methyltransferase [Polyangiales bacterium]